MMTAAASGPTLNRPVPDFSLGDYRHKVHTLGTLSGANGLLLGFPGDIWKPASVHRILMLQADAGRFARMGVPVALVIRDNVRTLHNFHASSPLPILFPLLSDADGTTHAGYAIEQTATLLLIDPSHVLRQKWQMGPDMIWPDMSEIYRAIQKLS